MMYHLRNIAAFCLALILVGLATSGCNKPPAVPDQPSGPTIVFKDSTANFTTTAEDPDADQVSCRMEDGAGTTTGWSEWVESGDPARVSFNWSSIGKRDVRAQAKDGDETFSDWSSSLNVNVGLPLNAPGRPSGPAAGFLTVTYDFSAAASNPDKDSVTYRFDWGDSDISDWSPFVADTALLNHAWEDTGTFEVRAQVRDVEGFYSVWSEPCTVTIFDPTGILVWQFDGDGRIWCSPAVGPDSTIYFGTKNVFYVYAVKPDGTLRWRFDVAGEVESSPAVGSDGVVYVGSNDNNLYAINPDGTAKWVFACGLGVRSSPAIGTDGTIYFGSNDDVFYALNPDGTEKWTYQTGSDVRSSPAIGTDGTVFVGSDDNSLYAFNPDGTVKWQFETERNVRSSPAVDSDGSVYFGSDNKLFAVDDAGNEKWQYAAGDSVISSPAIAPDGTILVGSDDTYLHALNEDGTLRWKYKTSAAIKSSPAVDTSGSVYVGSEDEYLHVVAADGTMLNRFKTGGKVQSSPAITRDGMVYFTSFDKYLYALRTVSRPAETPWPMFRHDARHTGRVGN